MGKGKILSHLGEGKYSVKLEYATSRAQEQIDLLNRNIRELQDKISTTQSERDQLESDYSDAYNDLQSTIEDLASLKPGTDEYESKLKELDKKQAAYQEALAAYSQAMQNKRGIELEITALEKRIETINKYLKKSETIEAWCVDYSLGLSGEVGTIEPAGKADQINIRPGYIDDAEHDPARDGKLSSVFNMTAAQTYYNYAMLPGARKWRPLYRTGVATGIDKENNTCNVNLDFCKFREIEGISLSLNQSFWLLDVPIDYMSCDAAVFEEYDEVVVRFEGYDWTKPVVIGFVKEPLPCCPCDPDPSLKISGPGKASRGEEIVLTDNCVNSGQVEISRPVGSQDHSESDGGLEFLGYKTDSDGNDIGYRFKMHDNGAGGYKVRIFYPGCLNYETGETADWAEDTHTIRCPDAGKWIHAGYGSNYPPGGDVPDYFYWTPDLSLWSIAENAGIDDVALSAEDGVYSSHVQFIWNSGRLDLDASECSDEGCIDRVENYDLCNSEDYNWEADILNAHWSKIKEEFKKNHFDVVETDSWCFYEKCNIVLGGDVECHYYLISGSNALTTSLWVAYEDATEGQEWHGGNIERYKWWE